MCICSSGSLSWRGERGGRAAASVRVAVPSATAVIARHSNARRLMGGRSRASCHDGLHRSDSPATAAVRVSPVEGSTAMPARARFQPVASSAAPAAEHAHAFFTEVSQICERIDLAAIERLADELARLRERGGRLFLLGVGGSAANCSHAVNDFRKICGIEAYAPTDNVSELTARTNDEGWASVFIEWLKVSRLSPADMLFIFSVGGGNREKNVSPNLVAALEYGKEVGAKIGGIVGRDGGYTAKVADACVIIPTVNPQNVTPHTEAFQAVVWHLLVSHPALKAAETKWESTK